MRHDEMLICDVTLHKKDFHKSIKEIRKIIEVDAKAAVEMIMDRVEELKKEKPNG